MTAETESRQECHWEDIDYGPFGFECIVAEVDDQAWNQMFTLNVQKFEQQVRRASRY